MSILDSAGMKWSRTEISPSPTLARVRAALRSELDQLGRQYPRLADYGASSPTAARAVLRAWKGRGTETRSRPARRRSVLPASGGILPSPTATGGRLNPPPTGGGWRL